ncbi:hypothetical protein C8J56DRAFT_881678 [Mycena floridula]|nr:hypothetical protein C8J56DRAFT_881678 [Mycena floridula]
MSPEKHQAIFLLGPWLIGSYLEILLMGVLCCQFAHYYSWYSDDRVTLKLLVVGLAVLSVLKSIQSFALIWIMLILTFGDLPNAINLNYTTWWQSGNPLMVAFIGLYVQGFFCHRLHAISNGNWWAVMPVAALMVFAFLSISLASSSWPKTLRQWMVVALSWWPRDTERGCTSRENLGGGIMGQQILGRRVDAVVDDDNVETVFIAKGDGPKIAIWCKSIIVTLISWKLTVRLVAAHFGSVFAGDLLLSLITVFYLTTRNSKKIVLPHTVGLLSALIRLTFQSAAPAAICTLLNLIFSQAYDGNNNLISTAFNMILPKLYAISMMWTLNQRKTIRAAQSSGNGWSSSNDPTTPRTRLQRATGRDIELDALGRGVQVLTHTETHIDVQDMFTRGPTGSEDYKTVEV